jgi:hypothetical protein
MPAPNDTRDLHQGVMLNDLYIPSPDLVKLLVIARNNYDWPSGTGAMESQQIIRNLEANVADYISTLNPHDAHTIITDVSKWAGNNDHAQTAINNASFDKKVDMQKAISYLLHDQVINGLDALCNLPGIRLVIASKIYRFCSPRVGAAVDRHASYFFNSLLIEGKGNACHFKREWNDNDHVTSRLATYTPHNYILNRNEYVETYLPILTRIADYLNTQSLLFHCAATKKDSHWTPADVEMAAYYWWACYGSR